MVVLMDPCEDSDNVLRSNRSREKTYMFDVVFDYTATQVSSSAALPHKIICCICIGHTWSLSFMVTENVRCSWDYLCVCVCVKGDLRFWKIQHDHSSRPPCYLLFLYFRRMFMWQQQKILLMVWLLVIMPQSLHMDPRVMLMWRFLFSVWIKIHMLFILIILNENSFKTNTFWT